MSMNWIDYPFDFTLSGDGVYQLRFTVTTFHPAIGLPPGTQTIRFDRLGQRRRFGRGWIRLTKDGKIQLSTATE